MWSVKKSNRFALSVSIILTKKFIFLEEHNLDHKKSHKNCELKALCFMHSFHTSALNVWNTINKICLPNARHKTTVSISITSVGTLVHKLLKVGYFKIPVSESCFSIASLVLMHNNLPVLLKAAIILLRPKCSSIIIFKEQIQCKHNSNNLQSTVSRLNLITPDVRKLQTHIKKMWKIIHLEMKHTLWWNIFQDKKATNHFRNHQDN